MTAPLSQSPPASRAPRWLLLVHQVPTTPSNARVKTWRRLQRVGALAVKNAVYVLPNSPQAREDFEWIRAEIEGMKGQATVFAADSVDAMADDEIVRGFRQARDQEYESVRRAAEKLLGRARRTGRAGARPAAAERRVRVLRERWRQIAALDFFGAAGSERTSAVLDELERTGRREPTIGEPPPGERLDPARFRGRVWLTRPRPGIDRLSSGWLIRRFIDADATFRFADDPGDLAGAIPFDMFGVELSHHGDRCTFETLVWRFGLDHDPALDRLGRLVHALDIGTGGELPADAAIVGRLVDGLQQVHAVDPELMERGLVFFEALYRSLVSSPAGPAHQPSRRVDRTLRRRSPPPRRRTRR